MTELPEAKRLAIGGPTTDYKMWNRVCVRVNRRTVAIAWARVQSHVYMNARIRDPLFQAIRFDG